MKLFLVVFIFIFGFLFMFCYKNKILIDFKSILRRGFHCKDDDYGLYCFNAVQGAGKTLSIVTILDNYPNKTIYCNLKSFCESHKNAVYINSFREIKNLCEEKGNCSNILVFFDEVFTIFDPQKPIPREYRAFFTQLRKKKLHFYTTCQNWTDLPIGFRKLCRFYVECSTKNFLWFGPAFLFNAVYSGYDLHYDKDTQEHVAPILRVFIKKASKKVANSYDTDEQILTLY